VSGVKVSIGAAGVGAGVEGAVGVDVEDDDELVPAQAARSEARHTAARRVIDIVSFAFVFKATPRTAARHMSRMAGEIVLANTPYSSPLSWRSRLNAVHP